MAKTTPTLPDDQSLITWARSQWAKSQREEAQKAEKAQAAAEIHTEREAYRWRRVAELGAEATLNLAEKDAYHAWLHEAGNEEQLAAHEAWVREQREAVGMPDGWQRLTRDEREIARRDCRDVHDPEELDRWYRRHLRDLEEVRLQEEAKSRPEREKAERARWRLMWDPVARQERREKALLAFQRGEALQVRLREIDAEERAALAAVREKFEAKRRSAQAGTREPSP